MNKEEIQKIIKSDVPMIDKKVAIKLYSEISDNYINNNKIYKSRNSKFFLLSYALSRIQKTIKETEIPEKTLKVIKDKLLLLQSLLSLHVFLRQSLGQLLHKVCAVRSEMK